MFAREEFVDQIHEPACHALVHRERDLPEVLAMEFSRSTSRWRALSSSSAMRMRIEPVSDIAGGAARREFNSKGIWASSPISRNLREQICCTDRLSQCEVTRGILFVPRLPSCHDANAQRRTFIARERDEVPAAPIGESDIGDEYIDVGLQIAEARSRLFQRRNRFHGVPVTLEERLHAQEATSNRVVLETAASG